VEKMGQSHHDLAFSLSGVAESIAANSLSPLREFGRLNSRKERTCCLMVRERIDEADSLG
jgi:hypothetical protein